MMPRGYDYIVGDMTFSLARLIEKARPKQVLIGAFEDTSGEAHTAKNRVEFIEKIRRLIRKFHGVSLGNTPISDLNLSLTGAPKVAGQGQAGQAVPKRYTITDKHGIEHDAYNVRIAVERSGALPLYLGDEAGLAGP
jgi:hypothetical protein